MLNCNIVIDLLPAYIDGLVSPETSAEIESHLEECESCRHICRRMRSPVSSQAVPERSINFLRKIKRRTWIIIGSTIAAAVLAIAAHTYIITVEIGSNDMRELFIAAGEGVPTEVLHATFEFTPNDKWVDWGYRGTTTTEDGKEVYIIRPTRRFISRDSGERTTLSYDTLLTGDAGPDIIIRFADRDIVYTYADILELANAAR